MEMISEKKEVQFRGPSSSEEFNEWTSDINYDLLQVFEAATKHGQEIPANMRMLVIENIFLQQKIKELEASLSDLEKTITNLPSQKKILTHSFSCDISPDSVDNYEVLEYKKEHGVLRAPSAQEISKLYLVNIDGENMVPTSLKYKVYESTSPINISEFDILASSLEDPEMHKIVDGDKSTFWLRRSIQDTNINEVYFCLELELPMNIINHTRANVLYIDPVPLSAITLLDIQYRTQNDWQRLPSYPTTGSNPTAIVKVGRESFCFPTRDIVGIRIYGKQPNWFLEQAKRTFYYGFRSVEVNYVSFQSAEARAKIKFQIPDQERQFMTVTKVTPLFSPGSIQPLDDAEAGEWVLAYKIVASGGEYSLGEQLPIGTKELSVEIGVNLVNDISPLLSGLEIEYESA